MIAMEPDDGCPDDDLLARHVEGKATAAEAQRVRAHTGSCAVCRRVVSDLICHLSPATPEPPTDAGDAPLFRGTQVGRYLVIDLIGAGSTGMVYSAYDVDLHRQVALK